MNLQFLFSQNFSGHRTAAEAAAAGRDLMNNGTTVLSHADSNEEPTEYDVEFKYAIARFYEGQLKLVAAASSAAHSGTGAFAAGADDIVSVIQ